MPEPQLPARAPTVFLARRSYRRRRLADAARLLPVLGFLLFCLPVLWEAPDAPAPRTALVLIYLLVVWLLLIGATAILSHRLASPDRPDPGGKG